MLLVPQLLALLHAAAPAHNHREFHATGRSYPACKSDSPADAVPAVSCSAPFRSLCLPHAHNGLLKHVGVGAAPDCCATCAQLPNCSNWELRGASRFILGSTPPCSQFGAAKRGVNCVSNALASREVVKRQHGGDARIRASVKTDDSQGLSGQGVLHALGRMVGIGTEEVEEERVEGQAPVENHRGEEDEDELYGHDGAWSHDWHEEHEEL